MKRPIAPGQDGSVLVEAALILILLFTLLSALIDLGFWAYENAQVANAARDGARVAILDYVTSSPSSEADSPGTFSSSDSLTSGSSDQLIQAAIASHFGGRAFTATVACYTTGTSTVISCSSAQPGSAEVSVQVQSPRPSYSFVGPRFGAALIRQTSTFEILGLPQVATTATAVASTMHISSMSGTSEGTHSAWDAAVTITVEDENGSAITGVTVSGSWDTTTSVDTTSCVTAASGSCSVTDGVATQLSGNSVTFTVSNLSDTGYSYNSSANSTSSQKVSKP